MMNGYSQEFKRASIGLLVTIIQNINPEKSKKYYKFFQKELGIKPDEFEDILEFQEFTHAHNLVIENEIESVRKELNYKRHQIMKFLMMLNRCIIIDGCNFENYQKFEKIRDSFLAKM